MMGKIRVALQQRVIPTYRVPFFEKLGQRPEITLSIFSGLPRPEEMISTANSISDVEFIHTRNIHLFTKPFYLCLQPGIHQWLKDFDPDVVVLEANPRYPSSRKAINWLKKENKGLIGWGLGVSNRRGLIDKLFSVSRRKFLHNFDAIIAYSKLGKAQYIQYKIEEEKVIVAPNSVVARPKSPMPLRTYDFQNNPPILLFVGRLQTRKRIDSLIRVCARLPQEIQPKLWIVGDGQILTDLKTYAEKVFPDTTFWGGVYGDQLEDLFKKADIFVMPGTGGLAIQQAMSFGLPVIVAEGDGTQSNMVYPENGWSIIPNNEEVLFSTLLQALSDPARLKKMSLNAFETIKNEVNIDIMTEVFIESIQQVYNLKNKNGK